MREILFRGKSADTSCWLFGVPIQTHIGTFIAYEENPHYCGQYGYMEIDEIGKVIPETVGQFTGLLDKNGKKVFEGDILSGRNNILHSVEFENGEFQLSTRTGQKILIAYAEDMEIIGNIHDNPEFMEVKTNVDTD